MGIKWSHQRVPVDSGEVPWTEAPADEPGGSGFKPTLSIFVFVA